MNKNNTLLKIEALRQRKKGRSYNEVSKSLNVPKSTLSCWLKDVQLSKESLERLKFRSREAGLKALLKRNKAQTFLARERAKKISQQAFSEVDAIKFNELKFIGCALYLGEGGKSSKRVDFTNSSPQIIRIMMHFFRKICKVEEKRFRVQLAIHDPGKIELSRKYWSDITDIPKDQFIKVSQAISKYSKKRRKNTLPFGTIQVRIADVQLFHKIQGWINGIAEKIDNMPG